MLTYHAGRALIPGSTVALLSKPSKMKVVHNGRLRRVHAWGIPAVITCPGAQFGANSICGECYANPKSQKRWAPSANYPNGHRSTRRAGTYGNANVQRAQAARLAWTQACLMTESGRESWVDAMVEAISGVTRSVPFFRVHDSGDMFTAAYVRMWVQVCLRLPDVQFWVPTRTWNIDTPGLPPLKRAALMQAAAALVELACLPNVAVRPSALFFESPPPVVPGLHAGTGASATAYTCHADEHGGHCGTCTRCWTDKYTETIYKAH
jgi:hypothetical protein